MPNFLEGVLRQLEDTLFGRKEQTDLNRYMNPQTPQAQLQAELESSTIPSTPELPWWEDEEDDSQLDPAHWYRSLVEDMTPRIPSEADRSNTYRNTKQGRRDIMRELDRGTSYEGSRLE